MQRRNPFVDDQAEVAHGDIEEDQDQDQDDDGFIEEDEECFDNDAIGHAQSLYRQQHREEGDEVGDEQDSSADENDDGMFYRSTKLKLTTP